MNRRPLPKPRRRPRRYTGRRRHEPMRDVIRVHGPAVVTNLMLAVLLVIPIRHEMWMRWII